MARDLNEHWDWIQRLVSRISRLESGAFLENSSISKGRMRFIGGLLRLDSGARLEVVGSASIEGPMSIVGTQTVTGIMNVIGPWNLAGAGGITGDVIQTGTTRIRSGGKVIVEGSDPVTLGLTSAGRPGLQFGTGSQVVGTSDGAQLNNAAGNGFVYAGDTVGMQRGSKSIEVTSAGIEVSLSTPPAGTTVYMVVSDAAGNLYRKAIAA
jgi:hypothetical protein